MTPLEQALERADLRDLIADLYPDAGVNPNLSKQRISAPWRGGDNPEVVSLSAKTTHDFKTGETWNAWTFLTEVAGYSKEDAARYLLARAGLADTPPGRRKAARRERVTKLQDQRRESWKRRELEAAHARQRTGSATGPCSYFERKQVSTFFNTHEVAAVTGPDGGELPGLTFGSTKWGTYAQLALRTLDGAVTGYQRIYDAKVLPGERDKDFIGPTKGAFVLLLPKGVKTQNLFTLLQMGYEVGVCEGIATGMSICLAKPKTVMLCALYAGNLTHVLGGLRERYGYTRTVDKAKRAVSITIWADNDAWGESNTGLTKAHQAALEWHCHVRAPNWKGRKLDGAEPTDFNDLHTLFGLEAVKRTRKQTPDTRLAFVKELGKQKLGAGKYLAPFELPETGHALLVKSPMETGKTHRLAEAIAQAKALKWRVLVVVHRESLADVLADRLGLENYNDYVASDLRHVNRGLVICFDSLHKLTIGGELPHYDLLIIDECEQVLRHTRGRHIKHKAANFTALTHYLRAAPRFIGLDAHAGTITTQTLARFARDKRVSWHRHDYHVGQGRTARMVFERHDALDALERSNVPTWYASDSLRRTRDLDAWLSEAGERGTLTINSETTSTDPVKAYFNDPTRAAPSYQRLIASPSVQTGLSDDSGHFQHVIGEFGGRISTPQDHAQSLARARRAPRLTVYANPARRAAKGQAELEREICEADKKEAELSGCETFATYEPDYLTHSTFVEARESISKVNAKHSLVRELTLAGFDVRFELPRNIGKDELERIRERGDAVREAGMRRYVSDRLHAKRIDWQAAKQLEDKHRKSQDELFELQQFKVREFYRLPDDVSDEALAEMLELDDYGKLRKQVEAYEGFVEPVDVAAARAEGHLEAKPLLGDARHYRLTHEFYQRLGEVIGLNPETEHQVDVWGVKVAELKAQVTALRAERPNVSTVRRGTIDRELGRIERELAKLEQATLETRYGATSASVKTFVAWCQDNLPALTRALKEMPTAERLTSGRIVEDIGKWLRGAGLKHIGEKTGDVRAYAVTLSSICKMRDLSRPRRDKWDLRHHTFKESSYSMVSETLETLSQTGETSPMLDPKPSAKPASWLDVFTDQLEAGRLDDFGPRKLAIIRQKLENNDYDWLHTLANSCTTGRVLGVVR